MCQCVILTAYSTKKYPKLPGSCSLFCRFIFRAMVFCIASISVRGIVIHAYALIEFLRLSQMYRLTCHPQFSAILLVEY